MSPRRRTILVLVAAAGLGVALATLAGGMLDDRDHAHSATVGLDAASDVVVLAGLPRHETLSSVDRFLGVVDPRVRLAVTSTTDAEVEVGIAPVEQVTAWLADTSHDRTTWVDGDARLRTTPVPGVDRATGRPEPDWLDRDAGTDVAVTWDPDAGRTAAVVMSPTGDDVAATVAVTLDHRLAISLAALLALAVIFVLADLVVATAAVRADGQQDPPAVDRDHATESPPGPSGGRDRWSAGVATTPPGS